MRIVVGLEPGCDAAAVADALRQAGASDVRGPAPSLPDVLVAEFAGRDPGHAVRAACELPGVRYAEPDRLTATDDPDVRAAGAAALPSAATVPRAAGRDARSPSAVVAGRGERDGGAAVGADHNLGSAPRRDLELDAADD